MTIKAKPTAYKSQHFRSRLEARWAAFFDIIGWQWTYEPYSLNQAYIPDFLIHGNAPFLVEVKPAATFRELVPVADDLRGRGLSFYMDENGNKPIDMLIVGASPTLPVEPERPFLFFERPLLGLSMDSFSAENDYAVWDNHHPALWVEEYGDFKHRPTGLHEGDGHLLYKANADYLNNCWRQAGNETQWKPVK